MKPLKLHAENYGPFPELEYTFEDGITVILGELVNPPDGVTSNGAGKSHLLAAAEIALFGPEGRTFEADHTWGALDPLVLDLVFEHAGEVYRVRRTYAPGRTSTLDFEQLERDVPTGREDYTTGGRGSDLADVWVPLTRESAKETQTRIEETIGMTRDLARNSWFLAQGAGSFATSDPAARKRLLSEAVFGLDSPWPKLAQHAKDDRVRVHKEILTLEGEVRAARVVAADREDADREHFTAVEDTKAAEDQLAAALRTVEQAQAEWEKTQTAGAERARLAASIDAARAALNEARTRAALVTQAEEAATEATEALAGLPTEAAAVEWEEAVAGLREVVALRTARRAEREQAIHEEERRRAERSRLARTMEQAHRLLDEAGVKLAVITEASDATCDRCHQPLVDADAREAATASLIAEMTEHRVAAEQAKAAIDALPPVEIPPAPETNEVEAQLAQAEQQLAAHRAGVAERIRLEDRLAQAQAVIANSSEDDLPGVLAAAEHRFAEAEQQLANAPAIDIASAERALATAKTEAAAARSHATAARERVIRAESRAGLVEQAEQAVILADRRLAELHTEMDTVDQLVTACGPDGIPALVLEARAVPFLEEQTNEILRRIGGSYQIEIRTLLPLKKDGDTRVGLEIAVTTADGQEAPLRKFSGGEHSRISVALRLALARLLARWHGASSGLLALDELAYLDDAGMPALLHLLEELDEFPVRMLVSHVPALRDAAERAVTVVNENGRARMRAAQAVSV